MASEVQDTTAPNDVDSGLQMAMSPSSAVSTSLVTSASLKDPHYSIGSLAITKSGVSVNSGMRHLRLVAPAIFIHSSFIDCIMSEVSGMEPAGRVALKGIIFGAEQLTWTRKIY